MANIELDGANKKIKVDSGDLTLDVPGDIILDADGADLVFADGGTNILKVTNSSSDAVFQPQVDAKDIKFNQYDGRTLLDINDGGFVGIANGATGPGQLRLYEDTDNGTNYTALQVGTQSGDITYTLPTADGSNGHALTTNGSGTLSWASAGTTYAGIDDQSSSNDDQLTITDTAIVINEDSDDVDFRIESNANANAFVVNGGDSRVGIGADPDLGATNSLHIKLGDSGASVQDDADALVIEDTHGSGMSILSGNDDEAKINFGDDGDNDIGGIIYAHAANTMTFRVNAATGLQITSDGRGLSQFSAKAWCSANGTGTVAILDSHNISSLSDHETGQLGMNFANNMANTNYVPIVNAWQGYAYTLGAMDINTSTFKAVQSNGSAYVDTNRVNALVFGD